MKVTSTPFSWTMAICAGLIVALLASEVALQIAGKADTTIANTLGYGIPLLIGFIIGVPVNPGTTTTSKP